MGRIVAIETKQMEIEVAVSNNVWQVPIVLSFIVANTKALGDLKGMFIEYFRNTNPNGDGSGSVSISDMETQGDIRGHNMELGIGRVHKISFFPDSEMFTGSGLEGDHFTEEAPSKSRK